MKKIIGLFTAFGVISSSAVSMNDIVSTQNNFNYTQEISDFSKATKLDYLDGTDSNFNAYFSKATINEVTADISKGLAPEDIVTDLKTNFNFQQNGISDYAVEKTMTYCQNHQAQILILIALNTGTAGIEFQVVNQEVTSASKVN